MIWLTWLERIGSSVEEPSGVPSTVATKSRTVCVPTPSVVALSRSRVDSPGSSSTGSGTSTVSPLLGAASIWTSTVSSRPLRTVAGNWPVALDRVTDGGPWTVTPPRVFSIQSRERVAAARASLTRARCQ